MFSLPTQGTSAEWVNCPNCRSVMLPLADFEIKEADTKGIDDEDAFFNFFFFGWVIAGMVALSQVMWDVIRQGGRTRRLERLKAEVLPRFPNSLICSRCLQVMRRL